MSKNKHPFVIAAVTRSVASVALPGIVATALRANRYGGVTELLGCARDAAKSVFLPVVATLLGWSVPMRYWPIFSPELLLQREYRCGHWSFVSAATGQARPIRSLLDLCATASGGDGELVREGAARANGANVSALFGSAISPEADDCAVLQRYFADTYKVATVSVKPCDHRAIGDYAIEAAYDPTRRVSVVIPTRDRVDLLQAAIDSVLKCGGCANVDLIVVDNGSVEPETLEYLRALTLEGRARVFRDAGAFNWSRINNMAVREATADVLVFLNNDIQSVHPGWLAKMASFAELSGIGCVGPMLLYADGSIQHAGVVVGMGRWADHIHKLGDPDAGFDQTPFVPPSITRPVLALTGACLAVSRRNFEALGGFDEAFEIVFSDVELCVRAHQSGLRNLYLGDVRLFHFESKSRDPRNVPDADFHRARVTLEPFRTRMCDPYFHPRLDKLSLVPKSDLLRTRLSKWIRR